MGAQLPLDRPFILVIRQRHLDAGCRSRSDACAISRALEEAFPGYQGLWRTGSGSAAVLDPDPQWEPLSGAGVVVPHPGAPGVLIRRAILGEWEHDGCGVVLAFDRGLRVPPGTRIRFTPGISAPSA